MQGMRRGVVTLLLAGSVMMNGYQVLRILVTPQAGPLGALTRGSFHWIMCDDPGAQTRACFEDLGVDYLVTKESNRACPFFTKAKDSLHGIGFFGAGEERLTLWRFTQ
jgi:hypothetical protein